METKHTPGPWTIIGGGQDARICTSTPNTEAIGLGIQNPAPILSHIARLHDMWLCPEHGGSVSANARLIAAAPDLLAALESCIKALDVAQERAEGDLFGAHHNNAMDAMDNARAAIAKARGA